MCIPQGDAGEYPVAGGWLGHTDNTRLSLSLVLPQYIPLHPLLVIYCQIMKKSQPKDKILSLKVQTSPWVGLQISHIWQDRKSYKVGCTRAHTGKGMEGPALLSALVWLHGSSSPCKIPAVATLSCFWCGMANRRKLQQWQRHASPTAQAASPLCLQINKNHFRFGFFLLSCPAHKASLRLLCRTVWVATTLKHRGTKWVVLAVERHACSFPKRCWGRVSGTGQLKWATWQGAQKTHLWISRDSHSYRIMAIP